MFKQANLNTGRSSLRLNEAVLEEQNDNTVLDSGILMGEGRIIT